MDDYYSYFFSTWKKNPENNVIVTSKLLNI